MIGASRVAAALAAEGQGSDEGLSADARTAQQEQPRNVGDAPAAEQMAGRSSPDPGLPRSSGCASRNRFPWAAIIAQGRRGVSSGTPLSVWRSGRWDAELNGRSVSPEEICDGKHVLVVTTSAFILAWVAIAASP